MFNYIPLQNLSPYDQIYNSLLKIEHVTHVHGLKVWSLTINQVEIICHLAVSVQGEDSKQIYNEVLQNATAMLQTEYGIQVVTIQIEDIKEETLKSCSGCLPLGG